MKFNINLQLIIEIVSKKVDIRFLEKSGRSQDRKIKQQFNFNKYIVFEKTVLNEEFK